MNVLKINLIWGVFAAMLLIGCSSDDIVEDLMDIIPSKINSSNAEEVARYGLDMAEIGSISKNVAEYVDTNWAGDPTSVNQTLDCSAIDPQFTGTVNVTGAIFPGIDLTIEYVNCQTSDLSLNGTVSVSQLVENTTKTSTVSGSLTAENANNVSISVSNFLFEKVSDTVTNPDDYVKTYSATLSIPLLGTLDADGSISGSDLNDPDNPLAGSTVIMTASDNSRAKLTSVGANGFTLEVDEDGDGTYEISPLANGSTDIFPW